MPFLLTSVIGSAFFLFLVQPLLAKQILPWFGGTAAVWAVCMVFYQVILLAGYLYAHLLTRFLNPRRQAFVHLAVVATSLLALPVGVYSLGRPDLAHGNPSLQIVSLLFRAIGAPYFVLSSTSPLMQAWYARLEPRGQAYKLFGWSNLSCALALLCFPFLLEPWLPLGGLNVFWSWGYALWTLVLTGAAVTVIRRNPEREAAIRHEGEEAPSWSRQAQWLGFSALGCVLMVGITNHLCQTVAPIPFLWTVPLLLYLLTFVVTFEREWYNRLWVMPAAAVAVLAMAWAFVWLPPGRMLGAGIPVFALGVFFGCFYCHGELAARKPSHAYLTHFYIVMAAGGAIGSMLVAFAAPRLFTTYAELPVTLAVLGVVMLFSVYRKNIWIDAVATLCAVFATAPGFAHLYTAGTHVESGRNFYGSLFVEENPAEKGLPPVRQIVHGAISHGSEFMAPGWYLRPTAYFGPRSAPGILLQNMPGQRHVGIIGLGAGTLASYGKPGDRIRYYEINPLVVDFARRHFRFLSDTPARVDVVVGDGRLELEREETQNFDLLIVDAFSGDSIPVHLLTRESFNVYRRHLKPGGLLALHVSNLYLNLQPIVAALAADQGWQSVPVRDTAGVDPGTRPSNWAVVGPPDTLARYPLHGTALSAGNAPVWTDQSSSLLKALQ